MFRVFAYKNIWGKQAFGLPLCSCDITWRDTGLEPESPQPNSPPQMDQQRLLSGCRSGSVIVCFLKLSDDRVYGIVCPTACMENV